MISTTSWVSGGQIKTVTTEQGPNETLEDFEIRHAGAVRTKLAEFPKDP